MARLDLGGVAFAALALLTLGSAAVVALARNVIHSAIALLGTLVGVAGLYGLLAPAGLSRRRASPHLCVARPFFSSRRCSRRASTKRRRRRTSRARERAQRAARERVHVAGLSAVAIDTVWPKGDVVAVTSTAKLGHALLGEYVLPFELASLVLLAALVGSVTLARRAVKPGVGE